MKQIRKQGQVSIAVCWLLAIGFGAQVAFSQQTNPAPQTARVTAVSPAEPPVRPGSEGIKVHGHWVIDVRNPDGSVVQHRVFENGLVTGGYLLTGMLGGYFVPSDFVVILAGGSAGPSICSGVGCAVVQSKTGLAGSNECSLFACSAGLTETVTLDTTHSIYSMALAGQFTATQAGYVGTVQTIAGFCGTSGTVDATTNPSACVSAPPAGSGANVFTGTAITGIPVALGQVVQITVTITFS